MKIGKIAVLLAVLVLFGTWAEAASIGDCNSGGRYEAIGDGTVQDCRTGLIWLENARCSDEAGVITPNSGFLTWPDAMKWVASLYGGSTGSPGPCGLTDGSYPGDWRLPTKTEWMAMVEYAKRYYANPVLTDGTGLAQWATGNTANVFTSVTATNYWSSTTLESDTTKAWVVDMGYGVMSDGGATKLAGHLVWPVRGGQAGSFGTLRIE